MMYLENSTSSPDVFLFMSNRTKNETALATLKEAPTNGLWVADYNKEKNLVTLSDGTTWKISKFNWGKYFRSVDPNPQCNWKVGDHLTLMCQDGGLLGDLLMNMYGTRSVFTHTYHLWNHATKEIVIVAKVSK